MNPLATVAVATSIAPTRRRLFFMNPFVSTGVRSTQPIYDGTLCMKHSGMCFCRRDKLFTPRYQGVVRRSIDARVPSSDVVRSWMLARVLKRKAEIVAEQPRKKAAAPAKAAPGAS